MSASQLAGARVAVVGAAGFLGSRLVERLSLECQATVSVLVRRVMSATALARFPIRLTVGDVLNPADLAATIEGCAVVFNCVKGKGKDPVARRAADVEGARAVVEAAAAAGARVVHLSTMAVYDRPTNGPFDERSRDVAPGDAYSDNKLAGERAALAEGARLRVPVCVVQPTVIYGPNAGVYGADILQEMQTHRLLLINGGTGICNAVYVDDVVTALLLAATSPAAAGERFLISGPEYPTWREFFSGFEQLVGASRTAAMSEADALALWRRANQRPRLLSESLRLLRQEVPIRRRLLATREGAAVRRVAERVLPDSWRARLKGSPEPAITSQELPIAAVRPWVVHNMARQARARIDKARDVLGYQPVFSLEAGMRLTGDWARWAGLAPGAQRHE